MNAMTDLIDQIAYNHWANLRVLSAAARLDPADLTRKVSSSFPSVHATLVHLLWAEELWLERWQGRSFAASLDPREFPDLESLRRRFQDICDRQLAYLDGLAADAAETAVSYVNFRRETWTYSLRRMVRHLVLHDAYHRGQLATLYRQFGVTPPSTDYLVYVDEEGGREL